MGRGASFDNLTKLAAAAKAATEAIIGNGEDEEEGREEGGLMLEGDELVDLEGEGKEGAFLPSSSSSSSSSTSAAKNLLNKHLKPINANNKSSKSKPSLPPSLPPHHPNRTLTKLGPNQLRLVCFGGYALVLLSMYGISPFFQHDAQTRIHMSPSLAGLVFSLSALTSMFITPLAAHLCKKLGRFQTLFLGYFTSLTANLGFGLSENISLMITFRAFQGT
jgi:hypothetical protein